MADEVQPTTGKIAVTDGDVSTESTAVDLTAGVKDGFVNKTDPNVPQAVRERIEFAEAVKHETDKEGNVTGWHKEAVA